MGPAKGILVSSRTALLIAFVMFFGALAVRWINHDRGMWGDEITTYWVSRLSPHQIVEERLTHGHLPTYFLLMHAWTNAVGSSKLMLRLPSIVPGALAVAALFLVCARRFPLGPSLLAAILLSLNATHLFVSQSCRMYGLTVLLEVLFAGCLLWDLRCQTWKSYLGYATVVAAGCSLHLLFLQMAAIGAGLIVWERLAAGDAHRPQGRRVEDTQKPECLRQNETRPADVRPKSVLHSLVRYLSPFCIGIALFVVWSSRLNPSGANPEPSWLDVSSSPVTASSQGGVPSHNLPNPFQVIIRIPFGDFDYWRFLDQSWIRHLVRALIWTLSIGLSWAALRQLRSPVFRSGSAGSDSAVATSELDDPLALEQWRVKRLALLWAVLPVVALLIGCMVVNWGPARIAPRWIAGSTGGWALLLALGVRLLPAPRWLSRSVAVLVVGLSTFIAVGWLGHQGDGLPQAFAYWQAHAGAGEKIFLAHRGYLEKAMEAEGMPLPPDRTRSGTVLDDTGPAFAVRLRDFAADDSTVWVISYRYPPLSVLNQAFVQLAPVWQADLVFHLNQCRVFRLSRSANNPAFHISPVGS